MAKIRVQPFTAIAESNIILHTSRRSKQVSVASNTGTRSTKVNTLFGEGAQTMKQPQTDAPHSLNIDRTSNHIDALKSGNNTSKGKSLGGVPCPGSDTPIGKSMVMLQDIRRKA
jgi:hypothetical protein